MDKTQSTESLEHIRHTLAHLTAASVLELYPGAQNAIGPAIEDGFYQEFELPIAISEKDLPTIEKKMRTKLKSWKHFILKKTSADEARKIFSWNKYKTELINDFENTGKDITITTTGDFVDLCKGGHVEDISKINPNAFKLVRVAGAYWKGDEKNIMLTRIYGFAFETPQALEAHLALRAEAEKRDHKKLGKELDLFLFSDLVGAGLPLWTPRGTLLRTILDEFIWQLRMAKGYERVTIPHITKKDLYDVSGHWEKFQEDLFHITTREGHEFAMKPMNCPHHTQIFARHPFSYREMPQRYAETTMVYRDEQSGELGGLSRVRSITQDDAHVFCRESQVKKEVFNVWDIINTFYGAFGFTELRVRLSLHDPKHFEKYLGAKEVWQKTEDQLREIVKERGMQAHEAPGEAAMYGPKVDFLASDALGREWQVATIQIDRNMPERFDLTCNNEKGEKERVVMIHAAIMGSIERFLSILIEHFAGKFPLWISPVQVAILPVSEHYVATAKKLAATFEEAEIRTEVDTSNESVGKKIRMAEKSYVPYMLVLGEKEKDLTSLAVRIRGQKDVGFFETEKLLELLKKKIMSKEIELTI